MNFNITKIELRVLSLKARLLRVQRGVEMTAVEVHMATYSRRQVAHTTDSTNSITTVVEVASGKGNA